MKPIAAFLTLAGLLIATEADAGWPFGHRGRSYVATQAAPVSTPYYGAVATSYAAPAVSSAAPDRVYTYSYYSRSPLPARTYSGYGSDDFPFLGTPYGHPYDPYTWNAMAGPGYGALARYYDPPVK